MFGLSDQLRRAALSVALNYVEGYARNGEKDYARFLDMSFGSVKESVFILEFCLEEKYFLEEDVRSVLNLGDRIGGMIWGILKSIRL